MLFLDGVGKPRGTTLILSSTLGAGSVERPPRRIHAHVKTPMSGFPAPDWKERQKTWMKRDDEAWIERGEKERSLGDERERNRETENG